MKIHRNTGRSAYNFVTPRSNKALYKFICVFIVLSFLVIVVSGISLGKETAETMDSNVDGEIETSAPAEILGEVSPIAVPNTLVGYGNLILVNYRYPCVYDAPEMVSILENTQYDYMVADYDVQIDKDVFSYLDNLFGDFERQNGGSSNVNISCAYRSKELQEELYNEKLEADGQEEADKWIAKPGYSEHQTGYTFDLSIIEGGDVYDYTGTGEYAWINENCYKYGFIVRYPVERAETTGIEYEPWHFRYVGAPHAEYIYKNDLCLEDYIELIRSKTVSDPLEINSENGRYAVYWQAKDNLMTETQLTVPMYENYSISGDNIDGFIVTVELK